MKLSKHTLSILKNFSQINSSIFLKKGNFIMTKSSNSTIFAEATIPDQIDTDVVIYDLNKFLSIMSLVGENAKVEVDDKDNVIRIKNEHSTVNIDHAQASTIVYPAKPIVFPVASVTFELKADEYKQITRVARSMKIDTLCISNNDDKIIIEGFHGAVDQNFEKPLYQIVVGEFDKPADDTKFKFYIKMSNIDMIESDYTVHLWGDGARIASKFEGESASYVIALETNSEHNF